MKPKGSAIVGCKAVLLAPLLFPIAVFAGLFRRLARRTPTELAELIERFLNGADNWAWDDIESVPVADVELEAIRRQAVSMGAPDTDEAGLRQLIGVIRQRFSINAA